MLVSQFSNEPIELFNTESSRIAMDGVLRDVQTTFGAIHPLLINGEHTFTKESLVSTNPSNPAEVIGYAAKATVQHADAALDAAWRAFESWRRWSQEDRSRLMLKAAAIMRRRKRELEAWLIYEIGKNFVEAAAEVAEMIDFTEYYARQALRHVGGLGSLTHAAGEENESFYIPLGAGVTIAPWNFPMALMTGMTVGAIVVGNTVVCKPAQDTVVSLSKVFDIFVEAGLPPGVVNYLPGLGREIGSYLVSHPRTRFINFTGSLAVGAEINESAAKLAKGQTWFKRVLLELGGKNAILVDETANLDDAAKGVIESVFGYSGQKCSACSRLIVVDSVYDAVLQRVIAKSKELVVDQAKDNPSYGPVCNEAQYKKVLSYIDIGREEAKLVTGGKAIDAPGYFIQPTIFGEVASTARIAQEEIFGPVVAAIRVKDFKKGLDIANNTVYGLTGALYSNDRNRILTARREFHVGNLYLNRKCTAAAVGIQPFGGFNLTGTDTKTGGPDYLLQFLQMKAVAERL